MKKIYMLLFSLILFSGCQKDEIVEPIVEKTNRVETVSIQEATDFLNTYRSKVGRTGKSAETPFVVGRPEGITHETIINSDKLLTVIPATTIYENHYSRILLLEIDNEVKAWVFSMYADKVNNGNYFSGELLITDLEGNFIDGYRIKNGFPVSQFIRSKTSTSKSAGEVCPEHGTCTADSTCVDCMQYLDEIIIMGDPAVSDSEPVIWYIEDDSFGGPSPDETEIYWDYSGGGGGSGTSTPIEEEVKIVNDLDNPCAYTVFYQLENGIYTSHPLSPEIEVPLNPFNLNPENLNSNPLNLTEEILSLFNSSDQFHYTIQDGPIQGNGSTIGSTTTISDRYLSTATRLSVARTMIHELVHAYLNVKYSNPLTLNSLDFRMLMDKYATETGYVVGTNQYHHNFMGRYFAAMAYSLKEWDAKHGSGGGLGWNYYYSMSFAGQFTVDQNGNVLTETKIFTELVPDPSARKVIIKNILDEMNSTADSQGEKC